MPTAVDSRPNPAAQSESPERQQLARMIEELEFGRIDGLLVIQGQPRFSPRPRCTRVFNLTAGDTYDARRSGREYRLRTMRALFRRLDSIRGAAVVSILVQHGLPVRLTVHEPDEA